MKIEFIDYKPTPDETKQLGVATVCIDDMIRLRYKVQAGREGKGFFIKPASHKIGEEYVPAFLIGSNFDDEDIQLCLRENLKKYLENGIGNDGIPF